ncbi:hypothetical protein PHMEG_00011358 [Phytophthora megakarya]|uniref:Uncharacterized protein n=1 Tax=Phytophthora megakarya TaxID=4795 RepID=A0A225WBH4_9STRA|nr:hypothetical protein PHMEG_00011358 [Phytophthora megakarya]
MKFKVDPVESPCGCSDWCSSGSCRNALEGIVCTTITCSRSSTDCGRRIKFTSITADYEAFKNFLCTCKAEGCRDEGRRDPLIKDVVTSRLRPKKVPAAAYVDDEDVSSGED